MATPDEPPVDAALEDSHERPRPREAPAPSGARGDGPGRPDRHPDRGDHGHAGPAHGQARAGPGVPERGHRPRRPLLHLSPGHRHGDEHARRVRPHELGDGLRRLDRPPGLGHAAGPALAREDRAGPRRRDRRGDRGRDPGRPADDPQAPGRRCCRRRLRREGRLRVRVLRAQGDVGAVERPGLGHPRAVRLLQRGLPPAPGDEGGAAPPPAAQPDDRGADPHRVQQGRSRARPARGQHPLRPRPRVGRPERDLQARGQGDRVPQRLGHHVHGQAGRDLDRVIRPSAHEPVGREEGPLADPRPQGRPAVRDVARRSATSSPG